MIIPQTISQNSRPSSAQKPSSAKKPQGENGGLVTKKSKIKTGEQSVTSAAGSNSAATTSAASTSAASHPMDKIEKVMAAQSAENRELKELILQNLYQEANSSYSCRCCRRFTGEGA